MDDHEAIQGLWRQVSTVARGGEVKSGTTHVLFDKDRVKFIDPSLVDGGDWATFELAPHSRPKRFVTMREVGGRHEHQRVERWLYELDGDALHLCWPNVFGDFPDAISDQEHGVITLARDRGPLPETKKASGKKPISVADLGDVVSDDNFEWWHVSLDLAPSKAVAVQLCFDTEPPREEIGGIATNFMAWLRANDPSARTFAAEKQLANCNDNWNEGTPITVQEFIQRVSLESATRYPGGHIELYYEDGDLFWGHCIVVSVEPGGNFKDAYVAG